MKKIRTYNNIAAKGLSVFPAERYDISSSQDNPDAILLRSHKLHNETLPESVLAVARAGAGVNNIPVADYTPKGIVVFNTPGANANAVKELVLASLLLGSRGITQSMNYVDSLADITDAAELHKKVELGKKQYGGSELDGKTLGVVGLGAIGAKIANLALGLGMNVIGYDPKLSVEAAWQLSSKVSRAENLNSLLARSDYITLHVPAIEATTGFINEESLSAIKDGAKIINLARGELVVEADIIAALDTGKIDAYIADFPSEALIKHDKVILFPHLGASTVEAEENCSIMGAKQLVDFLENGNIVNSVNFPSIAMERTTGFRLTFANDNVPKVLGTVLTLLAELNINVLDMVNKSRDDIAYTIMDIEQEPTLELINKVSAVEHVFHVRSV
ncbi:phosphoglycerate dehydrogenase [Vibrio sp. RC27]